MSLKTSTAWCRQVLYSCCALIVLAVEAGAQETEPDGGLWTGHQEAIVIGILVAIVGPVVTLIFSDRIKSTLRQTSDRVEQWLAEHGWRFETRYCWALAENHRWLGLVGVASRADRHPLRLADVFVPLRLATCSAGDCPCVPWSEAFADPRGRIVLLGRSGSGKSTLLSYLTLVLSGAVPHTLRERLGKPFPMLVRLRELGFDEGRRSVLELLESSTQVEGRPGALRQRLLHGGSVVMLDGLNELLNVELQHKAEEEIRELTRTYPDNLFVVTCRIAGWSNQLPGWHVYEVQHFTEDDIQEFINARHREMLLRERLNRLGPAPRPSQISYAEERAAEDGAARAASLWDELRANQGLLHVARTPLVLSFITLVHFHRVTKLPKARARIYERGLETLLKLWDRQDKRLDLVVLSVHEKLLVLRTIAYRFLEEDLLETDLETLEEIVEPHVVGLSVPMTASDLVERILRRSGILFELASGCYGFAHRTLLDHLAADHIVRKRLDQQLIDHIGEERWREVLLDAVGRVEPERAQALIRALIQHEGSSPLDLDVAGLTLAEEVQIGQDLRSEICHRLLQRIETDAEPSSSERLITVLRAADLEMAKDCMAQILRGRDADLRLRILRSLSELGESQGAALVPLLLNMLASSREELSVRVSAATALARIGTELDASGWAALAETRHASDVSLRRAATWAWCDLGRFTELGLVKVPAGEAVIGSDTNDADERPQHRIFLPTLYMGRNPVTVAEYRAFVELSGYAPEERRCLAGHRDHPVVVVTWNDARAYADWYGYDLPSEAQWEKAARGKDGRIYPWGDEWRPFFANTFDFWHSDGLDRMLAHLMRRGQARTTPVDHFSPIGDSPFGCADMCGNVWEWTRSILAPYPYDPSDGREHADVPRPRVVRGGAFSSEHRDVRCSSRFGLDPYRRLDLVGFRVVVAPFL